jgi:2-keto-4-pentenoate hydratase
MAKLQTLGGWKCLQPLEEGKIIAAPIFNVQKGEVAELFEDNQVARVEPEICFVLAQDLPVKEGDYSEAEIIAAIGSAHMALELMQSRFADDAGQSYYESLADCMLNQGVFIGPEIDKAAGVATSSLKITVTQGNEVRELDGKHPNDRAVDGLIWLVNYMGKRGVGLNAGAAIITGSFKGIVNVDFDIETTIAYEGLGEYQVTFKRQA